ncbi:MAG: hypothetical protein ACQEP8_03175, partial [Chlamydiota bacterium]
TDLQNTIKIAPAKQVVIEIALMHIIRSHQRMPVEVLVKKLAELEQDVSCQKQEIQQEQKEQPAPKVEDTQAPIAPEEAVKSSTPSKKEIRTGQHDTLVRFAAVELDGTVYNK